MIIHRFHDGSEGFEYQPGDRVRIRDTITKIFDEAARESTEAVIVGYAYPKETNWHISPLRVRWSPDWGPALCAPWQLAPTTATYNNATLEYVEWNALANKNESDTN